MTLLIIFLMFAAAFFFFSQLYRVALAWFVRARVDRRWEAWAKAMTAFASLPLATVNSIFLFNLVFFLAGLAANANLPIPRLAIYLDLMAEYKNWLLLLFSLLFLARMVPQTVAGSKIFAYSLEFTSGDAELRSGDNIPR